MEVSSASARDRWGVVHLSVYLAVLFLGSVDSFLRGSFSLLALFLGGLDGFAPGCHLSNRRLLLHRIQFLVREVSAIACILRHGQSSPGGFRARIVAVVLRLGLVFEFSVSSVWSFDGRSFNGRSWVLVMAYVWSAVLIKGGEGGFACIFGTLGAAFDGLWVGVGGAN